MLIGAHVSPAGGLPQAVARGVERGCEAIQIFNQSPRTWRASPYLDDDVQGFLEALATSPIEAVLIHAVYLLNCASDDPEIREKSLRSLTLSLQAGASIRARGVVLHPGTAKTGEAAPAIARAGATIKEALAESDGCELHLENTAGAGGTLGRSIEQLQQLLEAAGGDPRLGVCLDSCHLFASGYDIRTQAGMDELMAEVGGRLGAGRLRSLHLNDSATGLGSNRDRHANVGAGELGESGCASFLGVTGVQELPCVLETPGEKGTGALGAEVELAKRLHERGCRARRPARKPRANGAGSGLAAAGGRPASASPAGRR